MNPIRREVLNGLFVLVISTLLSAAIAAFEIKFNLQLWVWIVSGVGIAVSGYVVFEITLRLMAASAESTQRREEEWLKRVGNPARLELGLTGGGAGTALMVEAVKTMKPGNDLTILLYFTSEGGRTTSTTVPDAVRNQFYPAIVEQLRRGTIREYKRLLCFDHDVLATDHELKSGILRVGEGPGTINRNVAEHCRLMMETKGCSLYVAPAIVRNVVALFGTDKASITVDTHDQDTGAQGVLRVIIFYDPPNGEIIEQFRQIVRATERRMVGVHKIVFPEDAEPTAELATR